ncbi:hypothetical protein GLOIN_2v1584982 [Rhizophagus irregularis DAOM 181602=DAOM 197198]|uniref:Uncharacterized protein n=2 Tax=Rhizophagus irregularis TaxID=588596 RepID=A0A2N1N0J4_9GLOM|nr:hypothetical protein GLOIN_2v1584982 [Rhizophagus irregularis DAOM 181602=DAOM 197198]PKK67408.1 hypothetical protein RhiirC2_571524 [Rhizophagus irregularis]POG73668.1 hypothetical protein GLOIN_2v1584982 [Rhizophagus irregularis DAOM 181602=DAOM 197198]|eukprot:XP_025180534.1 hypothetical protein GLOIN_2v1584982 [Rhizophagus irregularis DAOM 181602=DAOM 197198]
MLMMFQSIMSFVQDFHFSNSLIRGITKKIADRHVFYTSIKIDNINIWWEISPCSGSAKDPNMV